MGSRRKRTSLVPVFYLKSRICRALLKLVFHRCLYWVCLHPPRSSVDENRVHFYLEGCNCDNFAAVGNLPNVVCSHVVVSDETTRLEN